MIAPPAPIGLVHRQGPPRDQAGQPVPEGIAEILLLVRILAAYGRHLAALLPQRGLWRGFATIARFLAASPTLTDTIARLHRGILRAVALERVLLKRAARGRDLQPLARPRRSAATDTASHPDPHAEAQQAAAPDPAPRPHHRPGRLDDRRPLWLETLPSLAEMEQEVRRRPLGRSLAAICLDLGIAPSLCAGWFWNRLFQAMMDYRGSIPGVMRELRRREAQFERDDWKHKHLSPPEQTRDGVRQVLGFFIGEPPVDPFRPEESLYPEVLYPGSLYLASASGTGPP